jgi:Patatin-like phospholipase
MDTVQPQGPIGPDPFKTVLDEEMRRIQNRWTAIEEAAKKADPSYSPLPRASSPEETIGLALSGGGIRSATFSLGVLQSLAKRGFLEKIDYLSTVSGGGYAGCFLGGFFLPKELREGKDVAEQQPFKDRCVEAYAELKSAANQTAQPGDCAGVRSMLEEGAPEAADKKAAVTGNKKEWSAVKAFDWLRNNGRYLAPRGAGDLIYVVAMQIRNWAAVQYVIGVMIVSLLMVFSTLRAWLIRYPKWRELEVLFLPEPGAAIYWSPGWVLVGAVGLFCVIPFGLAYWLAHAKVQHKRLLSRLPLWHMVVVILVLLGGMIWAYRVPGVPPSGGGLTSAFEGMPRVFWTAAACVVVSLFAMGIFLVGLAIERRACEGRPLDLKSLRTRYTKWLRFTFWMFLGGAGLALLGTIGQTVYAYAHVEAGVGGVAGVVSVVAAIVAGARPLFKWLGSGTKEAHPRIPFDALAAAAALVLLLITGGAWATLVQTAFWKGGPPAAVPVPSCEVSACGEEARRTWSHAKQIDLSRWGRGTDTNIVSLDSLGTPLVQGRTVAVAIGWMSIFLGGMVFLFLTTGMFLNFINMSSLHQFYAARLGRAYLGATNPDRFKNGLEAVTTPLQTDAIRLNAYYHEYLAAPVHLINVTVNQTRPAKGQLVQRDRKGMSMVIGPKYTIVNSAIFDRDDSSEGNLLPVNGWAARLAEQGAKPWCRFDSEELDLGDWCAISGAAFSTGMGMRTSLGLSLLAGLANVRLGYWWNFNTKHAWSVLLPAYRYLWGELMADFKGPQKPFWFLTDGGHFDNTAVYELVRRRVGTIVLCDNGCDPNYQFDDLGNLARKIRMDFGAEMEEMQVKLPEKLARYFTTAEKFADRDERKHKCALLYEIKYPPGAGKPAPRLGTLLIVLKPNMLPEAPIDVAQYAEANQEFPHQTTLDQFFDEAQWESYRKLGELIADEVITPDALRNEGAREALLGRVPEGQG